MPLDSQIVSVSLTQGLNTKTDPKQVQSEYLSIKNAVYQTLEQLNLRTGFAALSKTTYKPGSFGTITSGYGLSAINQALLEHDGINAWSRIGDSNQWSYAGQKQSITVSQLPIGSSSSAFFISLNSARASNGIECYVWIDRTDNQPISGNNTGTAYYMIFDTANDVAVFQPLGILTGVVMGTISSVRADAIGTNFFITTANGTVIRTYKIPSTSPDISSVTSTVVDAAAGISFIDTCVSSTALYVLGAKVYRVDAATQAVTSSAASTYGTVPNAGINFDSVQNNVWVSNISGTNIQAATLSATLTVVKALSVVGTIAGTATGGALSLWVSNNQAYVMSPTNNFNFQVVVSVLLNAGVYTSVQSTVFSNSQCCSKPYLNPSDLFLYFVGIFISNNNTDTNTIISTTSNPTQPTTFLLKLDVSLIGGGNIVPTVVARALSLQTGLPYGFQVVSTNTSIYFVAPANLTLISTTEWTFPNLQNTQDVVVTIPNLTFGAYIGPASVVVRTQFDFQTKMRSASLASNIYTSAGFVSNYDSAQEVENNFHLFPEIIGTTQASNTPGVANGTYGYTAIFRWPDSLGQIHRSAPAVPLNVLVTGGPKSVTLNIPLLYLTDKIQYFIDIYRTTNGGTIYYFLQTVRVVGTSSFGSFVDINTIDQVSTIELYTTGGEVDNIAPPATSFMTEYKNRLFLISSENPYSVWYTKQQITNFPAEFSDLFTLALESKGGPAMALAPLDDKLIIFKKNFIFYIVGDGPAPSGANNDFSYPQTIPSDSGVTEADSVIVFPGGVLFKGSKGIYLLDRALNVAYIGSDVEAYNSFTITSAVLDYTKQLIRYTLSNGISLVYDYFVKKWAVFDNISAVDSVISNGVYYYLKSDGTVEGEILTYGDDGAIIPMSFQTGWLSFAKIQGFQRFKELLLFGVNYSACTLRIDFAYDFNSTVEHSITLAITDAINPWQERFFPDRQKCESVQLTFTITPTVVGKALSLSGIAMEVGVKRGFNKMPASQSVG